MSLQEYKIYLTNGKMIRAAEERNIPEQKRLHNVFRTSKPDDVLIIGNEDTDRAFVPVRNILYISTGRDYD